MDVSVILVSYNTKELTKECLKSVYQFTKDVVFEVFVVDNNSHDGSAEMIGQEFPQVRLIRNPDNKGFGAANNIAIRQSNAKYVFLLNTDTLLLDNSVKQFFDFMEKQENQKIGACGGYLYYEDMTPGICGGSFFSPQSTLFKIFGLNKIFTNYCEKIKPKPIYSNNLETPFEIDCVIGADLFIRKKVLNEIGLFDEDFFLYHEEMDLEYRIKKASYKNIIIPAIKIIHKESKSSNEQKKESCSRRGQCMFYSKHFNYFLAFIIFLKGCLEHGKDFFNAYPRGYKIFK